MVLEDPLWQDGNDYPARLDRQFIEAVFDVEGVIKPSTGALLVGPRGAGANMSVDVAAGPWVIKGDDEADQGHYSSRSTAVENLPVGAAPGSDSRIDLVVARVRDAKVTGGVSNDWILEVIPGAVAAAPVAPAVPNTAIPLAQVLVAAGTASITAGMITDRRTAAGNAAYAMARTRGRTLADTTPGSTAVWTDWGATLNLGVTTSDTYVTADVTGSTLGPASVFRSGQARVGISFDAGATWTYGPTPYTQTDGTIQRSPLAASHYREGIGAGVDVRVKAQVLSGTAADFAFQQGSLLATLTSK
jgi:hypothetical protein